MRNADRGVILNRLIVDIDGVRGGPHRTNPSLRALQYEERQKALAYSIIVKIGCEPFTTIVEAIDLRLNTLKALTQRQLQVISVAVGELALEHVCLKDGEYEHNDRDHELHLNYGWHRGEQ